MVFDALVNLTPGQNNRTSSTVDALVLPCRQSFEKDFQFCKSVIALRAQWSQQSRHLTANCLLQVWQSTWGK